MYFVTLIGFKMIFKNQAKRFIYKSALCFSIICCFAIASNQDSNFELEVVEGIVWSMPANMSYREYMESMKNDQIKAEEEKKQEEKK